MRSSPSKEAAVVATRVRATNDTLTVDISDGRTISVPLVWYPRLVHATSKERSNCRLIGGGVGIHWPELDEDISVANLLGGQISGESQGSLQAWLEKRGGKKGGSRGRRGS